MSCSHTLLDLQPPRPNQSVYREDCTQCFDSIDSSSGLNVCLSCFNGGCAGDRNHGLLHHQSTKHPLALNIKRTRRDPSEDERPQKMSKLAIAAETEESRYETEKKVVCYPCAIEGVDLAVGNLSTVVEGVMKAMTFARQEEVKAWEQEFTECEHTLCLEQGPSRQTPAQDLGQCSMCGLKENLWLCLQCGNLGCGRAQFGGVGGNSHGLAHADASSHPVAVKLGSITPEGSADVYCYKCDEERVDSQLATHLAHWGINIAEREKTEKSLMEMQVEQNLKWDFSMTTEDGREMKPLFGAGLTGLKNIGNSCYLASIIQCLFSLPEFQSRYYHPKDTPPAATHPADDLETQLRKMADGLLSGRYSTPRTGVDTSPDTPEKSPQQQQEQQQAGLAPAMLKHLIGRGHEEFSTMRQQDAFEFLLHLFKLVTVSRHSAPLEDPVRSFRFAMEQRLQCLGCKKVRYRTDEQDNISIPVPARRKGGTASADTDASTQVNALKASDLETVTLKECLDIFTSVDTVELTCPSCSSKAGFSKQTKFKTFPVNLAINARRFELVNWVPVKLDIPLEVGNDVLDMSPYRSVGLQAGEEPLPEDADVGAANTAASSTNDRAMTSFVPNALAFSQLESMGFPANRCTKALHATGNADAESATTWLFAHMEDADIDEPLDLGSGGAGVTTAMGGSAGMTSADETEKIAQLGDMGITAPQARKALRECSGDVNRALDWVFSHPDDAGDDDGNNNNNVSTATSEATQSTSLAAEAPPSAEPQPQREIPGPPNFALDSLVCHKGASIHAGHYVAFINKTKKNKMTGSDDDAGSSWVLFNDEKVVQAENMDVDEIKRFAYVYFFRRVGA